MVVVDWLVGLRGMGWGCRHARRRRCQFLVPPAIEILERRTLLTSGALAATADVIPVFRAYNPNANYHFFTTARAEFDNAVAHGYLDETAGNPGFLVFASPQPGTSPVLRLYNPNNGRHYYTLNGSERDFLVSLGWRFEKTEGNMRAAAGPGETEIYRLYNRDSGVHLYTENAAAKDAILARFTGIWVQHSSIGFASLRSAGDSSMLGYASRPLQILRIPTNGRQYDPNAQVTVTFAAAGGKSLEVLPSTIASTHLEVAIPPFVRPDSSGLGSGNVSVTVRQDEGVNPPALYNVFSRYQINELPTPNASPGALTTEFLSQLQTLVDASIRSNQAILAASAGRAAVGPLITNLQLQQQSLEQMQYWTQSIQWGFAPEIWLGNAQGVDLVLNSDGLRIMDGILAAWISPTGEPPAIDNAMAAATSFAIAAGTPERTQAAGVDDEFNWVNRIGQEFVNGVRQTVADAAKTAAKKIGSILSPIVAVAGALVPGGAVAGTVMGAFVKAVPELAAASLNMSGQAANNIARGRGPSRVGEFLEAIEPMSEMAMKRIYSLAEDFVLEKIDGTDALKDSVSKVRMIRNLIDALQPGSAAASVKDALVQNNLKEATVKVHATSTQTTETGGGVSIVFDDDAPPTSSVTIPLRSSDPAEGNLSQDSITFTPDNWSESQTVTVTGVDDFVDDGDADFHIEAGPAESEDPAFNGYVPQVISLRNVDDGQNSDDSGGGDGGGDGGGGDGGGDTVPFSGTYNGSLNDSSGLGPYDMQVSVTSVQGTTVQASVTVTSAYGTVTGTLQGTLSGSGSTRQLTGPIHWSNGDTNDITATVSESSLSGTMYREGVTSGTFSLSK